MPEALWQEACAGARQLGAGRVARALGLNYAHLKERLLCSPREARIGAPKRSGLPQVATPEFLDLGRVADLGPPRGTTFITNRCHLLPPRQGTELAAGLAVHRFLGAPLQGRHHSTARRPPPAHRPTKRRDEPGASIARRLRCSVTPSRITASRWQSPRGSPRRRPARSPASRHRAAGSSRRNFRPR